MLSVDSTKPPKKQDARSRLDPGRHVVARTVELAVKKANDPMQGRHRVASLGTVIGVPACTVRKP
jgi:hypothetical protein